MFLFYRWNRRLMEKANDNGGGGGGANNPPDNQALLDRIAALEERLKDKTPPNEPKKDDPKPDDSLEDKARRQREALEASKSQSKELERSIRYNLQSEKWLKENESILPKSMASIFEAASKQNYDTDIDKERAIKVGVVSEFFAIEENVNQLTESQKNQLADFQALTKNEKEKRVAAFYDSVFEPCFEMIKRVQKATERSKGVTEASESETAYVKKMRELSEKRYLKKGI